jgi:hypothetical protein
MHRILAHAESEAIAYIKEAGTDIIINHSVLCSSIIQCKTCSLSKATQIISRRSAVESSEKHSFNRIN